MFGVYGDNFFDKCTIQFEIFRLGEHATDDVKVKLDIGDIRSIESQISSKRDELMRFQKEYVAAKVAYERAVVRHQKEAEAVKRLIAAREAAYAALTIPDVQNKDAPPASAASSTFTMPTIDTSAFKSFTFSNPFAKK